MPPARRLTLETRRVVEPAHSVGTSRCRSGPRVWIMPLANTHAIYIHHRHILRRRTDAAGMVEDLVPDGFELVHVVGESWLTR